jgi:hypothetical protein
MVEPGKNLAFDPETLEHEPQVQAAPHQLDSNFLLELAIGPGRAIDISHAASADYHDQLVDSNPATDASWRRCKGGSLVKRGGWHDITATLFVGSEQSFDLTSQFGVIAANALEVGAAIVGIEADRLRKQVLDPLPSFRSRIFTHACVSHEEYGSNPLCSPGILADAMTGPTFPDPSPMPSPEPSIPPVKEPPDDPRLPPSPAIDPDDPAEPNQI